MTHYTRADNGKPNGYVFKPDYITKAAIEKGSPLTSREVSDVIEAELWNRFVEEHKVTVHQVLVA